MMHEPFAEWAALYAVGALDGEEQTRFETHLAAGCKTCSNTLYDLSAVAAALPQTLPNAPLRPQIREQLMARVRADTVLPVTAASRTPALREVPLQTKRAYSWAWRDLLPWAGGLAVAGLAGIAVWSLHDAHVQLGDQRAAITQIEAKKTQLAAELQRREQELAQERLLTALISSTDTRVASMFGTEPDAMKAEGWIVWSPSKERGFIVVHFLPELPAGKEYQLWAVAGQEALPAGAFTVDSIGHNALMVQVEVAQPERFEITVEPTGGVGAPSGPVMMRGSPEPAPKHKLHLNIQG
jgi:anti-sigma-K factor RskA